MYRHIVRQAKDISTIYHRFISILSSHFVSCKIRIYKLMHIFIFHCIDIFAKCIHFEKYSLNAQVQVKRTVNQDTSERDLCGCYAVILKSINI